ncbi:MAG: type II toxin-antitoxin system VapC family toxin [Spirochaetia bacterium]|nr:type II toxin-antitoxin system VapC family toxin [Spirochaetia bacterium]
MKIILDTHVFLWSLSNPEKISPGNLSEIKTLSNTIYISSISIAEIMIKSSINKLDFDFDPIEMVEASGFEFLDFKAKDAVLLKNMPFYHKDPFDRMLIAQSIANKYHIMSDDTKFKLYDCRLI